MGYNPSKSLWYNPNIEYLIDHHIIEYDMQDAGFSLIKQYHLLPEIKIQELAALGKGFERHKAIGILQRNDKKFAKALLDKFAEIRGIFIGYNHLSDDYIVSVKKDAIFTIDKVQHSQFGTIIFVPKNEYTSYVRFANVNNLEIYYNDRSVDIKGMSDDAVNTHRLYMLSFIIEILSMIESKNGRIKRYLMKFISDYKSGSLDEAYYLEFNNKSQNINPQFNYLQIIVPLIKIILKEFE